MTSKLDIDTQRIRKRTSLCAALIIALAALGSAALAQAQRGVVGSYVFENNDCQFANCAQDSPSGFQRAGAFGINATGAGGAGIGDLYVTEIGGNEESGQRLQQFSSDGEFKNMWGLDVVATGPDNANETQAIRVTGAGGTFTLTYKGSTTAPLPYNASAAAVQASLNALGSLTVDVSGGPGDSAGSDPYLVTFAGQSGGVNQPLLLADDSLLTGAGAETTVYTTNPGATGYEICRAAEGDTCKRGLSGFSADAQLAGRIEGWALAIDQNSGDVYVSGLGGSISRFTADGSFIEAWGRDVVASGPGDSEVDERQKLTVAATGGTFTLSYGNGPAAQTTSGIPYDASAATVEARLNALSSINGRGGQVTVTGGPGDAAGSNPYVVAFGGSLVGDNAEDIGTSGAGLAGSIQRETIAEGGAPEICTVEDACKAAQNTTAVGGFGATMSDIAIAPPGAPNAGDVLVADPANARVQEFTPDGAFVRTFGWDVDVDDPSTEFEVCTAASGHLCKNGTPGIGIGQFTEGQGGSSLLWSIAEDASGAIYTVERPEGRTDAIRFGRVQRFLPSGEALTPSLFGTDETQSVAVRAAAGQFRLAFGAEPNGTQGTGDTVDGSTTITNIKTTKGTFAVGQPITKVSVGSATLPEDTIITAVGASKLTISKPAFATTTGSTFASSRPYQTADLPFDASAATVEAALDALPPVSGSGGSVSVSGGPGNATGSTPYLVAFDGGTLRTADAPTLVGLNGSTPLSGGTGPGANSVTVNTSVPGGPAGGSFGTGPLEVDVGPAGQVFIATQFPPTLETCADGSPTPSETRIQEYTPAGDLVDTSTRCVGLPPRTDTSGIRPVFSVNQGTGDPEALYRRRVLFPKNAFFYRIDVFSQPGSTPELTLDQPSNVASTGATLVGAINPRGPGSGYPPSAETAYRIEYKRSSASTWTQYINGTRVGAGNSPVPFSVGVNGLAPKTPYEVKVVTSKPLVPDVEQTTTFTTLGAPPAVGSVSSTNVGVSSADLHAKVNPQGTTTSYHFDYGTTTAYGESTAETQIGEGLDPEAVSDHIEGLQDATYHFRVVAANAEGTSISPDQTFTFHPPICPNQTLRQQTNAAYLPDCRAYELVSPEDAGGTVLFSGGPQSAYATSPPRLAFTGQFGEIQEGGKSPINTTGDLYIATRSATGWHSRYIGPSSTEAGCVGGRPITSGTGFPTTIQNDVMATPDLGKVIDWNLGNPLECVFGTYGAISSSDFNTAAEGSNAPYVWDANGASLGRWPTNLDEVPGAAANFACPQDPSLHAYPQGFRGNVPVSYFCTSQVSASKDLRHFVFSTASGLFGEGGITAAPGSAYDNDTVTGTVTLISKLPDGSPIVQEQPKNAGTEELIQFPHVSADGSRILMGTAVTPLCKQNDFPVGPDSGKICPVISQPTHLYLRVDQAVTYDVSGGRPVHYIDSTPDGKKVYFTTPDRLTSDDTDASADLYLWDEAASPHLARISVGTGPTGNSDACSAAWTAKCGAAPYDDSAISKTKGNRGGLGGWANIDPNPGYTDNSVADESGDIYFYSPEQLDNGQGTPGAQNLYVYRKGAVRFVAALSSDPYCITPGEDFFPSRIGMCSNGAVGRLQVTPDGRFAALITTTRLSEYDNNGHAEMYRYDADTGELRCVSCRLDDLPAQADVLGSMGGRYITDDGRVFFDSYEALDPRDTNEGKDTYEFVDGRAQLITSGTGAEGSNLGFSSESVPGLYGVSGDGTDAYFSTFDSLVGQDRNGANLKFYDARVGGGFAFVPPAQPCAAADECHGPSSAAPELSPPATGAALGPRGNEGTPKKKKKKRHRKRHHAGHRQSSGNAPRHGNPSRGVKR